MRVEGQVFKDGQEQHVKAGLNHRTSRKVFCDAFRRHLNSHFYSLAFHGVKSFSLFNFF